MNWYRRSLSDHDTHRGHLRRGRVLAACGVEFSPLRAWRKGGSALPGEPTDPEQVVWSVTGSACPANRPRFPAPRVNRRQGSDVP